MSRTKEDLESAALVLATFMVQVVPHGKRAPSLYEDAVAQACNWVEGCGLGRPNDQFVLEKLSLVYGVDFWEFRTS